MIIKWNRFLFLLPVLLFNFASFGQESSSIDNKSIQDYFGTLVVKLAPQNKAVNSINKKVAALINAGAAANNSAEYETALRTLAIEWKVYELMSRRENPTVLPILVSLLNQSSSNSFISPKYVE